MAPLCLLRAPMFDGRGRWVDDLETMLAREYPFVCTPETGPIAARPWVVMFRESDRNG